MSEQNVATLSLMEENSGTELKRKYESTSGAKIWETAMFQKIWSTAKVRKMALGGGCLASLLIICYVSFACSDGDFNDNKVDSCTLSPILVPNLYELKYDFDVASRTFDGEVTISGEVLNRTNSLVLDCAVNVSETILIDDNVQLRGEHKHHENMLEISFDRFLEPEVMYKLFIKFSGEIRKARGIFGGEYPSFNGSESFFIATEFQPNYAKFAFPCIDRPAYKARYTLNISRESQSKALSNMPVSSSRHDANDEKKIWDYFEETPKMSTYTFAFVIAEVEKTGPENYGSTMWVAPGNQELASYAAALAPKYIKRLEEYTDIKYEMPKMDHVALPHMTSTAMENWGLITYKQEVLHLNMTTRTIRNEFALLWILAHEITHQWFGNLVTCSSWAFTWLNEGLTSFLHFFISGQEFPEWDMLGLMMSEEVLKIMDDEGFAAVALTKENCLTDASDAFSMPSYYKGAAIVRTLYYMLGEEGLRNGLRSYLKANKYGCVTQSDLWDHFDEEARKHNVIPDNKTIQTLMETWSNNQGFPYITMERNEDSITLKQDRLVYFLPDDSPPQKWWIPLSYTTSFERNFSKVAPRFWMDPDKDVSVLNFHLNYNDWIIFNIEQSGYYRVLYDDLSWKAITEQLLNDMNSIPPLNRAKLIDDAFTLAFYKKLNYNVPLSLARYLTQENHYYPWSAAIKALDHIHFYIKRSDINDRYEKYLLKLVENVFNMLSKTQVGNIYDSKDRDYKARLLYGKILHFACNLGHKGCEKKAWSVMEYLLDNNFEKIRENRDEIYPLMCTMVSLGKREVWDLAFEMYKKEKLFKPKEELMDALKCTKDKEVWKDLARKALNKEEGFSTIDLLSSSLNDKKSYCFIIEVIKELLEEDGERVEELATMIQDISGVPMAEECKQELEDLAVKYIESGEDQDEIITALRKSNNSWQRLKEIGEWFDIENNTINVGADFSDSGEDNNPNERSLYYDGMHDSIELPYPHLRSPHDYDYELRHGKAKEETTSSAKSASAEFNLYILLFSVLPSPLYLTYMLFAPLI